MKIAILETAKTNQKTTVDAHTRNSLIIAEFLNADFYCSLDDYKNYKNQIYDIIIISYASFYAPVNYILRILNKNPLSKLFWVTNEYNISKNGAFFKNKPHKVISNYNGSDYTINLNLLLAREPNKLVEKKYDCIYYGTFRINRVEYFQTYLQKGIYLSCSSSKNFKKFKHIGCNPKYISQIKWVNKKEALNYFRYSLYIEDKYTHNTYNHMANRFYEALFCNVVQFFDINCKNSIQQSGLVFDDYFYVRTHSELIDKINETNKGKNWEKAMSFQAKWNEQAIKQRPKMLETLKNIIISSCK